MAKKKKIKLKDFPNEHQLRVMASAGLDWELVEEDLIKLLEKHIETRINEELTIFCRCGKPMENTGKTIEIENLIGDAPVMMGDPYILNLYACNYCGNQALVKELNEDEYYEI